MTTWNPGLLPGACHFACQDIGLKPPSISTVKIINGSGTVIVIVGLCDLIIEIAIALKALGAGGGGVFGQL